MTGRELRVLRLLRSGPLYEGAFQIMATDAPLAKYRQAARSLVRQGYVTAHPVERASAPMYALTDAGREIVEAMTP